MTIAVVEGWIEEPLRLFVQDARVLVAVLLHPNGQVLGQHGFTRAVDVMSACALAAAINASSAELGRQLDGKPFDVVHHAGRKRQVFLAPVATPRGSLVCLAVFDEATSLGLVQLYFGELRARFAAVTSAPAPAAALPANFELELNRNLAVLFGRA